MTAVNRYTNYRAPTEDGQTLCVPPWDSAKDLLLANREYRLAHSYDLLGQSLAQLAKDARAAVLAEAVNYTRSYADVDPSALDDAPLILSGHQPDLVHPGVWLKNFAAAELAAASGGTAINLIIDSDLCRQPAIRVPTGTVEQPRTETIAYDQMSVEVPYEERAIVDRSTWNSFATRTARKIAPLLTDPMVTSWWPEVISRSHANPNLGQAMAQARHALEIQWQSQSLELPQSRICRTTPFRWFSLHLLANLSRFRSAYNQVLADYRREHRLRNHVQPVPDLAEEEGWLEAPFWIWSTDNPRRRALFVRPGRHELSLSDRFGWEATLPISADGEATSAVERLAEWEAHGIKLRTRALITTLFARLVLADVFVHGIGGAKYDQVTDAISQRFFGFAPPGYIMLSGTLRLPLDHPSVASSKELELRQALRDLDYHPETQVGRLELDRDERARVDATIAKKNLWVQTPKTHANALERHEKIVSANEALQPWLAPLRVNFERELATTKQQLRANKIFESREYPFCLFSRDLLRNFLLDFSSSIP